MYIQESELILNDDGSIFHLHLKPEQLAETVILVGDPSRVAQVASFFDRQECAVENREFKTITGWYGNRRISVVSTGIGTDNIDIVLNELDALANIDLKTRDLKTQTTSLTIVRIGTSGGLQPFVPVGSFVIAEKSIGLDGVLNFYARRNEICDLDLERSFVSQLDYHPSHAAPYVVEADAELVARIGRNDITKGITLSANGFYGPQGRVLRLPLNDPDINKKISTFEYDGKKITNYEMESSAVAGLAKLLGHKAVTVCTIIANRLAGNATVRYGGSMEQLIKTVLDRIS
ncbi:MAG: nucleoside phosphorylase [Bacteroidales bacterium]|jgi:uridine phosphorylase|nr:nucleoside phosphorylase [Bacteroidales bacterium]